MYGSGFCGLFYSKVNLLLTALILINICEKPFRVNKIFADFIVLFLAFNLTWYEF